MNHQIKISKREETSNDMIKLNTALTCTYILCTRFKLETCGSGSFHPVEVKSKLLFLVHSNTRCAGEACTVEEKGTCMHHQPAATMHPLALTRSSARARGARNAKPARGEQAKNACTCPASPPRAPRHRSRCHAAGDDDDG